MSLRLALTYAVMRTALVGLTIPGSGHHRRPRWGRRAAYGARTALRVAAAYPDPPLERYRAAHRRPGRRPNAA